MRTPSNIKQDCPLSNHRLWVYVRLPVRLDSVCITVYLHEHCYEIRSTSQKRFGPPAQGIRSRPAVLGGWDPPGWRY